MDNYVCADLAPCAVCINAFWGALLARMYFVLRATSDDSKRDRGSSDEGVSEGNDNYEDWGTLKDKYRKKL